MNFDGLFFIVFSVVFFVRGLYWLAFESEHVDEYGVKR